ncbi:hypothetical protein TWF481_006312 [Arthrobotrys musiformis]|uniref:Uncharacterized protein n=1 Tax=Arthrobotrys musiformis TaxID=47236 RepID=A0AAV9WHH6_9PEZI
MAASVSSKGEPLKVLTAGNHADEGIEPELVESSRKSKRCVCPGPLCSVDWPWNINCIDGSTDAQVDSTQGH